MSGRESGACRIIDDSIYQFPGVRAPVKLFTQLREIDFIGEMFLVPNPPEEYLRFKYGEGWMTPKKTGYEKDIMKMISGVSPPRQCRDAETVSLKAYPSMARLQAQSTRP